MKKRAQGRKLNRKRSQRKALVSGLAESLVNYERIETTEAKAKELRPYIEKYITKSRQNNVANARLLRRNFSADATKKLLNDLGPRFSNRKGGYTRIIKLPPRNRDNASRAVIEFVE